MQIKNHLLAVACAAASLALLVPELRAQNYLEVGDAGSTPGTAQATGLIQSAGSGTQNILGTLTGANDADVYTLTINAPTLFSATTVNATTGTSLDTQLFLFNSAGAPIYANDDATGFTLQSTLPAGTSFTATLAPGTYFLAISLSGNDPVNTSNQLVFNPGVPTTAVRGPAPGLNPNAFSDFNSNNTFAQSGAYQITIVPEPSTWALTVAGATIVGIILRRRRARLA